MIELNFILSHVLFNKKSTAESVLPIQNKTVAETYGGDEHQRGTAMSDVKVKTQNLSFLSKVR